MAHVACELDGHFFGRERDAPPPRARARAARSRRRPFHTHAPKTNNHKGEADSTLDLLWKKKATEISQ